mgnify:CR=1 FL=1
MSTRPGRDFLHRSEHNPLLTVNDVPVRCNTVFNGTPIKVDDEYLMLLRVEGRQGYSFFWLARGDDGAHFRLDPRPCMLPAREPPWDVWEESGIEDPRLTKLDDRYYVLYTAVGRYGHRIALAETEDLRTYRRLGMISGPGNKDGVLFPQKVNDLYARLDRPIGNGVGCVWISYSPDLLHWGRSRHVFGPRPRLWDGYRVGASAPPILTEYGWLEIYHGVKMTSAGPIYRVGTIMLDRDDPSRVVGHGLSPLLSPREDYERIGDIGNVVFACGAIVEEDRSVKVYYGAADTAICMATGDLDEIIASCFPRRSGEEEEL